MDFLSYFQPFISTEMSSHGLHPVYAGTGHCVELIVEQEMPVVFAAFRMSGITISHVRNEFFPSNR